MIKSILISFNHVIGQDRQGVSVLTKGNLLIRSLGISTFPCWHHGGMNVKPVPGLFSPPAMLTQSSPIHDCSEVNPTKLNGNCAQISILNARVI